MNLKQAFNLLSQGTKIRDLSQPEYTYVYFKVTSLNSGIDICSLLNETGESVNLEKVLNPVSQWEEYFIPKFIFAYKLKNNASVLLTSLPYYTWNDAIIGQIINNSDVEWYDRLDDSRTF